MPAELSQILKSISTSRSHLLKHLTSCSSEEFTWKPYPECKSIREICVHLLAGDRASVEALKIGGFPEWELIERQVSSEYADATQEELIKELSASREKVCSFIERTYSSVDLATPTKMWVSEEPLVQQLMHFVEEDHYHAGQVAFIRLALNPAWDYYAQIFS